MLSFGSPSFLWGLLALLPVTLFHLLRQSFRRQASGSNWIWGRIASEAAGARRPRIRALLLLALQLLAVALAVLAAARPALILRRVLPPALAVLVDVSASMGSPDESGPTGSHATRLEAAVQLASRSLLALPRGSPVALFAAAGELRLLEEGGSDHGASAARLKQLRPTDESFAEMRVTQELKTWSARQRGSWELQVYTDGGLDFGGSLLSSLQIPTRFVLIGQDGGGMGLADLRLERSASSWHAVARAWNGEDGDRDLTLRLAHDGKEVSGKDLRMTPGWNRLELALPQPPSPGAWELTGSQAGRVRGRARLVLSAPPPRRVLLVGAPDPWILSALGGPSFMLTQSPSLPSLPRADFDLVIAEGIRVPAGLGVPLLSVGAIPEGAALRPGAMVRGPLSTAAGTALNRFVRWEGSSVGESLSLLPPTDAQPIAYVAGKVVAAEWTEGTQPCVFVGFLPSESDAGLTGAWPLFLRNVLDRAAPREDDQSAWTIDAGEFAQRAVPQGFILHGEGAPEIRARGGLVTLFGSSAGFFPWSAGGETGLLAVNVPAEELDTEPRALSVARAPATPEPAGTEGRPDSVTLLGGPALGRILLLLAALCLGAEWILWRGLPRPLRRRPRRNHAAG